MRVGMRYIDFFQDNIFEHCVLSLHFQDRNLANQSTALHTKVRHDDEYISDLRMSNMANLERDGENKVGSIIDIDTGAYNTWGRPRKRPRISPILTQNR